MRERERESEGKGYLSENDVGYLRVLFYIFSLQVSKTWLHLVYVCIRVHRLITSLRSTFGQQPKAVGELSQHFYELLLQQMS